MNQQKKQNEHILVGINGANPLGFLAALGTLRSCSLCKPAWDPKLYWCARAVWNPALKFGIAITQDELLEQLALFLEKSPGSEAFELSDNIKFSPDCFRKIAADALERARFDEQEYVRFLAALGSEAVTDDKGMIVDTALRTMSGAGHQHFLKSMRKIREETKKTDLKSALFHQWTYADEKPSLRWDPVDDRRYALRWRDPSGDTIMTVRGANRLAIEGLPLMSTAPVGQQLHTIGFRGKGSKDTFWAWPMWRFPVGLDTVRSLLTIKVLQKPVFTHQDFDALQARGIGEIYRSQRITVGKYRNFTAAVPVEPAT